MSIIIKIAGYQGERSVHTRAVQAFSESIHRLAGDTVRVDFVQNIVSQGHKAADLLDQTESGEIDACYFSSSYLGGRVPELRLFDQHFAVPDRRHAYAILDGALGRCLAEAISKRTGFAALAYWDNGLRHISSAAGPIHKPADCQGLTLRTLASDDHQRVFRSLGFEPIAIDVRDLPDAVASGRVDAQENPLTNIYNFGLHKTHKYITLTQHLLGVAPVLFNKKSLATWPPSVRELIDAALKEATEKQRRFAAEDDVRCRQAMEAEGCVIVELSKTERDAFIAASSHELAITRSSFDENLLQLFQADMNSLDEKLLS
ncbi:MAG: TRAP transporter substrate-binding protein [Granulosicoccus sp.]|nr:TRAP transporter substrate-binding protein [Granulosicoccus sp.]